MSQGPSTLGSMMASSLLPTATTISAMSSSAQGEFSALIRVHSPVDPKSTLPAISMNPIRAACLASTGIASSRLPSTTSTCRSTSCTFARTFSLWGGTKWIIRSSRTGNSRRGAGAPTASGAKNCRGGFMRPSKIWLCRLEQCKGRAKWGGARGCPRKPHLGRFCSGAFMQPFSGLLVVVFTTFLPGPLATLMLGEAGAEVIKIEQPGGENARRFPPMIDGESAAFVMLNRGKTSVSLDLKNEVERAKLTQLIKRADILVEQFRPGVM